jgi:hypothetical protein
MIKMGALKEHEDPSYELNLVKRFVTETERHGDPIHLSRALAMEADAHAKLNRFELALKSIARLRKIYQPEQHTRLICHAYGSDRVAQCISLSCMWQTELGQHRDALSTCDYVLHTLMPIMEPSFVHNSFVILLPVIWILKDNGMARKAREVFSKHVVEAFHTYIQEGATTPCQNLIGPIRMILDLDEKNHNLDEETFHQYLDWALTTDLYFGDAANNSTILLGSPVDLISAEICLLLSRRCHDKFSIQKQLIRMGMDLCQHVIQLCRQKHAQMSHRRAKPILDQLQMAWHQIEMLETNSLPYSAE